MANFEKAYWSTDGNNISVRMPISKVDKDRRIVSGWATTDSIDKQGDIVNSDASAKAFDEFRGNVREQHTPLAVGKVVSFKQDKYFDKNNDEFYNGIYVDVYVSKGAEDTWHKINEGILTGFSIGGSINDSEEMYNKQLDKPVRVIKDYDLYELSLVDNPANPDSNIVSVQKLNATEEKVEKNYLENVYWCPTSDNVILSDKSDYSCPDCSKHMTNIGFVESNDVNKAEVVKSLITSFEKVSDGKSDKNKAIDEDIAKSIADENIEKEGSNVGILNKKSSEEAAPIEKSEDAAVEAETVEEPAEETTEEVVEKAEDAAEDVEAVEKSEDAVEDSAEETVEKAEETEEATTEEVVEKSTTPNEEGSTDDLAKAVSEIKDSVADSLGDLAAVVKGIAEQVAEMKKSLDGVQEEVTTVKGNVTEFEGRVDAVEADTAVRKSGDLGGIVQEENTTEKSMWGGRFLKAADLYR